MKHIEAGRRFSVPNFSLMLWSVLNLLTSKGVYSQYTPFGFQSGVSENEVVADSFAGSIYYDEGRKTIFMTGGTYLDRIKTGSSGERSDCLLSTLKMPDPQNKATYSNENNRFEFLQLGISSVNEVCSDIEVYSPNTFEPDDAVKVPTLFGIGHTESGGLFTELKQSSFSAAVYGFSLVMEVLTDAAGYVSLATKAPTDLLGGALFYNDKVQYPVAMTHNLNRNYVYVAMMSSSNVDTNIGADNLDTTAGGGFTTPKLGKDFSFTIKKLKMKTTNEIANQPNDQLRRVFDVMWTREYEPNGDPQSRIADIMYIATKYHSGHLLFAGTTYGYGQAFGSSTPPTINNDIDGYVTKLLASDGKMEENSSKVYSKRIQSLDFSNGSTSTTSSGKKDEIKGLCQYQPIDDDVQNLDEGPTYFYVVGSTTGLMRNIPNAPTNPNGAKSPFVMKISVETMETVWIQQLFTNGTSDAVAYSCSVTNDKKQVHVAGTVYGGDALLHGENLQKKTESAGKSDIFVASFNTLDGSEVFVKQTGSKEDDWLARGKGISSDIDGNPIVLGTTRGAFHKPRNDGEIRTDQNTAEIVVFSMRKNDGSVQEPVDSPHAKITPTPPVEIKKPGVDEESNVKKVADETGEVFMIVILCIVFFGVIFFFIAKIYVRNDIEYDGDWDGKHDNVMQYLEDFDDKNVELHVRHSATGGIHGIYDFDHRGYEYEKNNDEVTVGLTSAADHIDTDTDAILKDALFMDDEKYAKNGTNNTLQRNDSKKDDDLLDDGPDRRQSYLGLVDSYNQSWVERSPHAMAPNNQTSSSASPTPPTSAFPTHLQEGHIDADYDSGDDQVRETWGKEIV